MPCILTSGRLLAECKAGMSGEKTFFFAKYNDIDYASVVVGVDGSITDLGTLQLYRFEMANGVGNVIETLNSTEESGVAYLDQIATLVLQHIEQADLADLNSLKKGRWGVFALDYEGNIRWYGYLNGASANGGPSDSGTAPGDPKSLTMTFQARENDYAPFLDPFTTSPFDNMIGVTVTPAY